jgi:LmbE family N-acetylglucosaminyl deacetylase
MPDRELPRRILAIHAHPDDIEFQCAGTLALLRDRGCEIVYASMTPGDCGSAEMGCEEIAAVRREEARQAAALLGAECHCLEFRDLSIAIDNDSRHRVTEFIRRVRPDVVITAPPVDYMSDHEATSQLVREACFAASAPNYSTRQWEPAPATERIPYLYYVDPLEGIDYFGREIPPEFIVDVSTTFELRQKMLACHDSQRAWLRAQHGIDEYLDSGQRWAARRGGQVGVQYGEAFRQHKGHPYPHANILKELLGDLVHEFDEGMRR